MAAAGLSPDTLGCGGALTANPCCRIAVLHVHLPLENMWYLLRFTGHPASVFHPRSCSRFALYIAALISSQALRRVTMNPAINSEPNPRCYVHLTKLAA